MKKFLVTLLVAMLALTCVALADDTYEVDTWYNHLIEYHGWYDVWEDCVDPHTDIAAKGLEYRLPEYFKLPTCTEQGYCKHDNGVDNNGVALPDKVYHLEPLGHLWDDGKIAQGSCTEGATLTQTCVRPWRANGAKCGETKTTTIIGTHTYGIVVVRKANCVEAKISYEGCTTCGQPKGDKYLKTWWEDGKKGATIKIDGEVYHWAADHAIVPTTHKLLSPWMTTEVASCTTPGVEYRACPYCGFEQTNVLPALGHSFDGLCSENYDHLHKASRTTLRVNVANCQTVALYLDVQYCAHEGCNEYQVLAPKNLLTLASDAALNVKNGAEVKKALDAIDDNYKKLPDDFANIYFELEKDTDGLYNAAKGHHIPDESTYKLTVVAPQSCKKYTTGDAAGTYGLYNEKVYCAVCKGLAGEFCNNGKDQEYEQGKHTFGDWEHLFDASEDSEFVSYWRRQCSVCLQYETSVEGPCGKYNHQAAAPVKENVVKATFTAAGSYEEVVYCSICKIELSRDEKVEAMLEGLNPADGKIWEDGKAIEGTGMVEFNGGKFYVVDGVLQNAMGVTNVGGEFLFLAHGQLQEVTQLAEYDGEWFYVVDGEVQVGFNGLVAYDGAKFLVGAGRVQFEQTTLYNEDGVWYLISAGQVATSYTGAFTYDGVVFQVVNGIVK